MQSAEIAGSPVDLEAIVRTCRAHHVCTLDLFGSATTGRFDPERSDVDLLVRFDVPAGQSVLDAFFALRDSLEAILHRKVDLLFDGDMENPYFRASVERQRRRLFPRREF